MVLKKSVVWVSFLSIPLSVSLWGKPLPAQEKPVSPVEELRLDAPGGSMEGLPVHSQVGATCYAYAGAVAIDAWRNTFSRLNLSDRTNPFELAIGNGQLKNGQVRFSDSVAEGGLCSVIKYGSKQGVCTLKTLPLRVEDGDSLGELVKSLGRLQKAYKKLPPSAKEGSREKELLGELKETLGAYGLSSAEMPSDEQLRQALKKTSQGFQRAVLSEPWCANQREELDAPLSCRNDPTVYEAPESIASKIENWLESPQSLPVGIAYCSKLLRRGPKYSAFSHRVRDFQVPDLDECGGHVSLVTGKRKNPESGALEFLIHNSWGKGCQRYASEWECHQGKIWVDAQTLTQNTYSLMKLSGKR